MALLSFKTKAWSASHTKRARSFYFSIGRFCLAIAVLEAFEPGPPKEHTNAQS